MEGDSDIKGVKPGIAACTASSLTILVVTLAYVISIFSRTEFKRGG